MRRNRVLSMSLVAAIVIVAVFALLGTLAAAEPAPAGAGLESALDPASGGVALALPAPRAQLLDPDWRKWVNDAAWSPGMIVTVETSDTIKVVDVVTALPNQPIELVERWTPGELKLLDIQVQPGGSATTVEIGRVAWQVPEGASKTYTLTKWFHVEPCTWARTILTETLSVPGQPAVERLVVVSKVPPALWIDSVYNGTVRPGDVATLTLQYGNTGGNENGVWIRNNFPAEAPFAWSDPPPDVIGPGRLMARWNVGDLAKGSVGEILVAVAVSETAPSPSIIEVWDGIFDHVDVQRDAVTSTFTVEAPVPVTWDKWVNELPWSPDLVVTAATSETIEVVDTVAGGGPFVLGESWNPEHLSLTGYEASAGGVTASGGGMEWTVTEAPAGPATLTKTFHVEPGFWDWTVLEELLRVDGAPGPRVRLVPVEHRYPPITFPEGEWPWYAQGEIAVHPEPPIAGLPTELCAEVVNHDPDHAHAVLVEFAVANFGIGLPFHPVGHSEVLVPPGGHATGCTVWVPPTPDHWCIEVRLMEGERPYMISQRNVDVDEPLAPNTPHPLTFPVRNPFDHPVTITLGLVPHVPGWGLELSQDVLLNVQPGDDVREVVLTVTPPGELPAEATPIVDVEAYVEGELIGGFRKISRPPVILHPSPDPPYAEREITVEPYPGLAGRPTEICVELRNPTPFPQEVAVQFSWAAFGIGLGFTPIDGLRPVVLPPHSVVRECIHWIPPVSGHVCLQVELFIEGYAPQRSQRNIDVNEPLRPHVPDQLTFPVRNPFDHPVTITLGLVPHLPGWGLELSQDVLLNVQPGDDVREVVLTVTPPDDLPGDGTPVVDVEAYVEGELIGGFRKTFRPPVPIHRPRDPVYAESEISVDPYPAIAGMPTRLGVELFNPTDHDQLVTATFSVAPFGIGLSFETAHISPNPIRIFVPAHGAATGHVIWNPPMGRGKFCVRVELQLAGHQPIWSQRNIDVGEPLRPGQPHQLVFQVGGWPHTGPVTISLGLVPHKPGWQFSLVPDTLFNVVPGQQESVTLTVVPPPEGPLGTGDPIVDVEAFVDGELIGGFRKMDVPPIPIHKPHERGYAESEISIDPYPPQQGQPTSVSAEIHNTSEETVTVNLEFGWAKFGLGIPFTMTGMVPPTRTVTLGAEMTKSVGVTWTPPQGGHQCVQVRLSDPSGTYEPQLSQRNVDVAERPPCDVTKVFSFTVYNDSPFTVTVDIGMVTFNVPADWAVTTVPSDTLEIGPFGEGTVEVRVVIPCPETTTALSGQQALVAMQQAANGVPTIDVEGYVAGELLGGIEIQFEGKGERTVYLPVVLRRS